METTKRQRWDEATARELVEEWEHSGLTLAEFEREWGVPGWKLRWWSKRLRAQRPTFIELAAVAAAPTERAACTGRARVVVNSVIVEVDGLDDVAAVFVARLVRDLSGGAQ